MNGSIGTLAEEVLSEVKSNQLLKFAEVNILKTASEHPPAQTEIGQLLQKVASALRSKSDELTVGDVESFLGSITNAN